MDFPRWHHLRYYVSQFVRHFPQRLRQTDTWMDIHTDIQTITCCLMSDIVFCREWTSPGDTICGTTSVSSSDVFLIGTDRQMDGHTDKQLPVVWCQTWCSVVNGLPQVTPSEVLRQSVRPTFSSEVKTDRYMNGHTYRHTDYYLLFDVRHCVL